MYMRDSGKMDRRMVWENSSPQMAAVLMENGLKISSMGQESKVFQMGKNTQAAL